MGPVRRRIGPRGCQRGAWSVPLGLQGGVLLLELLQAMLGGLGGGGRPLSHHDMVPSRLQREGTQVRAQKVCTCGQPAQLNG